MARTEEVTKLPLDRWFQIFGIHPLHANQVVIPTLPPTVCAQPWLQHAWQGIDRVGREDLALAIKQAEDDIERVLQTRLLPTWEVDEWRPTERFFRPELTNISVTDIRGYSQIVIARWKHFITGGIEAKELVDDNAAITYSDSDTDGYDETATVSVAVTFTDECEVCIYYPGKAGDDAWEIRPTNVSINTGTGIATITFRRELAVLEELLESFDPSDVDGTDDAQFLTTVDVYRKYNDPQRQVQFLWEPISSCTICNGNGCPECAYDTQEGCLMLRGDPRTAIVSYRPATWNQDTLEFDSTEWSVKRQPDLVRLWYYAGIRDKKKSCPIREMKGELERAVAYYAASLLDRPLCECNNVGEFIKYWKRDLALAGEGEELASLDDELLGNPFGSKRGAVFAWQRASKSRDLVQEIAI